MPYIESVTETFSSRSMKISTDRVRDYVRTFDVVIAGPNARTIAPDTVLTAIGVPRRWDFYVSASGSFDIYSTCREIEAKQDTQDPYLWRVTARYSNKVEREDINRADNPLSRPAEISYTSLVIERPLWKDLKGVTVVNSANDLYSPPPTREEHILVMTIKRNQPAYNALLYLKYHGAVNSDIFFGFPPGRVKCAKIDGMRAFESGFYHWPTTFEFHIRLENNEEPPADLPGIKDDTGTVVPQPPGPAPVLSSDEYALRAWQCEILDRGYRQQSVVDGKQVYSYILDAAGKPVTEPALLDGKGKVRYKQERPVFRVHTYRRPLPFAALQLI